MPCVRLTLCGFQLNHPMRDAGTISIVLSCKFLKDRRREKFLSERERCACVCNNRRMTEFSAARRAHFVQRRSKIIIFAHKKWRPTGFSPDTHTHLICAEENNTWMAFLQRWLAGCHLAFHASHETKSNLHAREREWIKLGSRTNSRISWARRTKRSRAPCVFFGRTTFRFEQKHTLLFCTSLGLAGESSGGLIKYCVQHSVEQSCLYQVAKSLLPTYKIHSSNFSPWKLIQAKLLRGSLRRFAAREFDAGFCPSRRCSHFPGLSDCHQEYTNREGYNSCNLRGSSVGRFNHSWRVKRGESLIFDSSKVRLWQMV